MFEEIFKYKTANVNKLKSYGFKLNGKVYEFKTDILNGEFELYVFVSSGGKVSTKVCEKDTGEEYILYLVESAVGEFVGKVRAAVENALTDISANCFEREIFKSAQAKELIKYVQNKYNDELEYLWSKFPNNAIWRSKDNKKWYGLIISLPKRKLGLNSDEIVEILDLRAEPETIEELVDNKTYFLAYHMNKKSWLTICLDGSASTNEIIKLIDKSYELALNKKIKGE